RKPSLARHEAIFGFIFIAPWIVGFLALQLGPMLASLVLSFTEYQIVAPPEFIGLANYIKMFGSDASFRDAVRVTLTYGVVAVPLQLVGGLIVALLLNQKVPGLTIWRTVYYLPSVVSGVSVAMLWVWIFHTEFGLINLVLRVVANIQGPAWLSHPNWALPALIIMSLWGVGSSMIVNLAGLQGIPTELYEAASIDGATWWSKFWKVTLPMLSPVLFFNLVMGVIGSFQYFTNAYVMTGGGPGRATLFYNLYLYNNAFQYYKMGYASALAWVLFLIILAFTLLIFKSSPLWVYYEGTVKGR
ncbi:MAG: sugar ABC transporter permease, partial [Chloroflexi bacterium]|nr:sugar ABC transporter permease [Chloroflexota bacterium]